MNKVAIGKTCEGVYNGLNNPKVTVERILKEKASDIEELILEMVTKIEPIEFQEAVGHLVISGGKRARAVISLLSCEAVGGDPKFALPVAVSAELIHTASLVHDDIVDDNVTRRGRDSVHVKWDLPTAVLTGDLLSAMATKAMLSIAGQIAIFTPDNFIITNTSKNSFENAINTLSVFTDTWLTLCLGKEADSVLKKKDFVTKEDVFKMMYQKTAILYELAAKSGAMAGNGTSEEVKALGDYGKLMGLAFQIKDDILGLIADEKQFGKHVGADIREGKKTMMIVHALNNGVDKDPILVALGNKNATTNQILSAIDTLKEAGSIDYSKKMAISLGDRAKKSLDVLLPSDSKNQLLNITDYLVNDRDW